MPSYDSEKGSSLRHHRRRTPPLEESTDRTKTTPVWKANKNRNTKSSGPVSRALFAVFFLPARTV